MKRSLSSTPSYSDWLNSSKPYPALGSKEAHHAIEKLQKNILDDGIELVKVFLAISKKEQLKRFEGRLNDPYKQWKLTLEDVQARAKWDDYVEAVDEMFKKTHIPDSPWNFISAEDKHHARVTLGGSNKGFAPSLQVDGGSCASAAC